MLAAAERAERFRALHRADRLFVLPNAWDVPSARIFEDAGFPAIATSSAGMLVSLGYPDGEGIPRKEFFAAVRRIAGRLSVPVSADIVAGFGRGPQTTARTARTVLDAGVVGVNLEDQDPRTERLIPLRRQLAKIRAIREAGEAAGIPVVINARTDALWRGEGTPEERFHEAVRRARAFRDAGADCVYPMRLTAAEEIARFLRDSPGPLNVMIRPGLPSLDELERLGVRRVSFGPSASYAAMGLLRRVGHEILSERSFRSLVEGGITFDELNRLAGPAAGGAASTPGPIASAEPGETQPDGPPGPA